MIVGSYLLLLLGVLGATDIALYHSFSHGIRSHPDSRAELVTHSLRGPTYALLFLGMPNFAFKGWWFAGLIALLVFDVGISIVDFSLEKRSREFFSGLPSGEYVLHTLMAMVFGAMVACVFFEGGRWFSEPTTLVYVPEMFPLVLRLVFAIMAIMVFVSGIQDAMAVVRLGTRPRRAQSLKTRAEDP